MTPTAFDNTFNGAVADAFIAKLNPTGSALLYSTFLGGSDNEAPPTSPSTLRAAST